MKPLEEGLNNSCRPRMMRCVYICVCTIHEYTKYMYMILQVHVCTSAEVLVPSAEVLVPSAEC